MNKSNRIKLMPRFILIFLGCFFAIPVLLVGQKKEEVIVQSGHIGRINHLVFSSDNRLLASAGEDRTLRIWHLPTGKLMSTFLHPLQVLSSDFIVQEEELVSVCQDGIVRIWSVTESRITREYPMGGGLVSRAKVIVQGVTPFVLINENLFALNVQRTAFEKVDSQVDDFTFKDGKPVVIKTNRVIFSAGKEESKKIFADKKITDSYNIEGRDQAFVFDQVAARIQRNRVELYNKKTGKKKTFQGDYLDDVFTDIVYSPKYNVAIVSNTDNNLYLINVSRRKVIKKLTEHVDEVYTLALTNDESLFASAGKDRSITIWDMATKRPLKTLFSKTYSIQTLDFIPETQQIAFGDELGNLKLIDLNDKNLSVQASRIHRYPLVQLQYQGGSLYSVGKDNRIRKSTMYLEQEESARIIKRFTMAYGMMNTFNLYFESPFDFKSLQVQDQVVTNVGFSIKTKTRSFSKKNLNKVRYSGAGILPEVSVPGFIENSPYNHQGGITDYMAIPGRYITSGAEGSIKLWDQAEQNLLVTLIPQGSKQSKVVITPENYYMVDKTSLDAIAFKSGSNLFLPQQFDLKYNRPDLVLEKLGGFSPDLIEAYHRAYKKRVSKAGFTEEMIENDNVTVPEIRILNTNIPLKTKESEFVLQVACTGNQVGLKAISLLVNGVPVFGAKGKVIQNRNAFEVNQNITVHLSTGLNKISVSVFNESGLESLRESIEITYEPASTPKPDLHLVTIGVSQYQASAMNLQYAAKDGKDLMTLFKNQKGVFREVITHPLFDEEVTTENVLKLKESLMKTSINDVVIIFVAGHGLLDKDLDYYFGTYNVDFKNPERNGLHYDDLETLLDGIPARKKALMIDACHSGEIDKEEIELVTKNETLNNTGTIKFRNFGGNDVKSKNLGLQNSFDLSRQLFTDLRKGSGTTVLSAASGVQLAQESSEWRNGAFTYCLLSGLKDMKADLNNDKKVMLSELQAYLFVEVSKITGGTQQPTSRIENMESDWQLW